MGSRGRCTAWQDEEAVAPGAVGVVVVSAVAERPPPDGVDLWPGGIAVPEVVSLSFDVAAAGAFVAAVSPEKFGDWLFAWLAGIDVPGEGAAPLLNLHRQFAIPGSRGGSMGPIADVTGVELVPLTSFLVASTSI